MKVHERLKICRDGMRPIVACALVLAFAHAGALGEDSPPAARPNIIVILADDFGHELVGANGGESYATPNLDRLAASGARFTHCYAQPLCTPTRVQLLTGLYNQRNYVRFAHLDPGARTFAQVLRDTGYRTCAAGKWQLGGGSEAPRSFGFDEHLLWQLTVRKSRYANPVLERDGQEIEYPGAYGPDVIADFVVDFLRRRRDEPFLVYYPMLLTHAPFEPPPGSPGWDLRAGGGGEQGDRRHFPAMVAHADKEVGKIVAALEDLGLRERTLVIFTGDNGSPRGMVSRLAGREARGGKGETTGAGTHVPLIVSWPGVIAKGMVRDDLVDSTDFLPAVLDAARVPLPAGLVPDGRSFLPQLRGEPGNPRRWVYSWYSRDGGPPAIESARTRRFKLYGDGRFHDVAADPGEEHDLGRGDLGPEAAAAREELAAVLRSFQGTRGKLPTAAVASSADPEEAARRLEAAGATVFRKEGRVVEVILEGREVTVEMLRDAGSLPGLTDLSLERTSTDDAGIELLAGLERLEWLNLYRTKVTDRALATLSRLPRLKHLPVGETGITDAGLAHLANLRGLEYLGLRGNRITDAGLAHVAGLAGLKGLHLGATGVTDAGLARLRELHGLEKLWLDGAAVTDASVEHLALLRGLQELHVASTRLTPDGLAALRVALPRCAVESGPGAPAPVPLRVATFDLDATPPLGSHLAYDRVTGTWDMGLRARGIVLLGAGDPIVLCAIDWIGIANEAHDVFQAALAGAAGTVPGRVAVHALHQHDAPDCDFSAEKILKEAGLDARQYEGSFQRRFLAELEAAVREALPKARAVTRLGLGDAAVKEVASNRRLLGPDGKVRAVRYTACQDADLRAEPEGTIDPVVSLVSFWNGEQPVAVLSYYATHPQSYYRTGIPNPDFPGLARFLRQLAVPEALHVHFNGAGGNVGAGKYNDGSPENRRVLAERLADGMRRAWESTRREPLTTEAVAWAVEPVVLPPAKHLSLAEFEALARAKDPELAAKGGASRMAWLRRAREGRAIDVACLTLGRARILHLPGELFVEYQLAAKAHRPDLFVCMAAYGDYGPWYIGTAAAYDEGGYETSPGATNVGPEAEGVLLPAIRKLLGTRP